jgi:RimJ/RimL family protein N-acetyltransferase
MARRKSAMIERTDCRAISSTIRSYAMSIAPPLLTTSRLTLRPHTRDDFLESYAMWSDPEVIRYIGGKPFTREEVWARLLRYAGHWAMLGYGYWVVREKESGPVSR